MVKTKRDLDDARGKGKKKPQPPPPPTSTGSKGGTRKRKWEETQGHSWGQPQTWDLLAPVPEEPEQFRQDRENAWYQRQRDNAAYQQRQQDRDNAAYWRNKSQLHDDNYDNYQPEDRFDYRTTT